MRTLLPPIMLIAAALTVNAQDLVRRLDGPQLKIEEGGWTVQPRQRINPPSNSRYALESIQPIYRAEDSPQLLSWRTMANDSVSYPPQPNASGRQSAKYQQLVDIRFTVKNFGSKNISAVGWTVAFIDPAGRSAHQRLRFHSRVKLPQEKTATLFGTTPFNKKWERLEAALKNRSAQAMIAITSIEYSDSTRWQRR